MILQDCLDYLIRGSTMWLCTSSDSGQLNKDMVHLQKGQGLHAIKRIVGAYGVVLQMMLMRKTLLRTAMQRNSLWRRIIDTRIYLGSSLWIALALDLPYMCLKARLWIAVGLDLP